MSICDVASITVRPAAPEDMFVLGHLGALLIAQHHSLDARRFINGTPRTASRYSVFLEAERQRGDALVLVAAAGGIVLGYAYAAIEGNDFMTLRGSAGVLHDLFVDPARWCEGIGRMLVEAVRSELEARGAPQLILSTAARNETAQYFFASIGFRPTMIEMALDLAPVEPI